MSQQQVATAIVLTRVDYGEADRILTVLTPQRGKLRLIAKGVRRVKSKLAGGIELFSVSDITYIQGRSDIGTLVSARLQTHYGNIVSDIQRTMLGYDLLKRVHKITEDEAEPAYFDLLQGALAGLNELSLPLPLLELWVDMHLLRVTGHAPELLYDGTGNRLQATEQYAFDFDTMQFSVQAGGVYGAAHIKLLRVAYAAESPLALAHIQNAETVSSGALQLVQNMLRVQLRV